MKRTQQNINTTLPSTLKNDSNTLYHALSAKPRRSGRGCKDALDFFCS